MCILSLVIQPLSVSVNFVPFIPPHMGKIIRGRATQSGWTLSLVVPAMSVDVILAHHHPMSWNFIAIVTNLLYLMNHWRTLRLIN